MEKRYVDQGGVNAIVVKLRLPDGTMFEQDGKIDYIEPTVSANTDTILICAQDTQPEMGPGPTRRGGQPHPDGRGVRHRAGRGDRALMALGVPRAAVLSDQQGNYVFVVDSQNRAEQRRIQLGQSTPDTAVVMSGLSEGEMVVVDGIQRVRQGMQVTPGPAYPGPGVDTPAGASPGPQASGAGTGPAAAATSPSSATPTSGSPAGGAAGSGGSAGTSSGH